MLESPVSGNHLMEKDEQGYWSATIPQLLPGAWYKFRLDGEALHPDPASLSQPSGVHGPSEITDLGSFDWQDEGWNGIPLGNMIIYELHTGCFSPTHDFEGVLHRLDYFLELGINTIEVMPLAQFPGSRNWGYDGAFPFAVQNSYGGAQGLQRLVDAAHQRGIAVLVDVVYNHLGPEGCYLTEFGPYFTNRYRTPWGNSLNFDDCWSDAVRNFYLQNVRMWLEDYRVDGLRLDAVHAIRDFSAVHIIQQLKEMALDIARRTGRRKELIAEIDLNDPRYISAFEKGGYGLDGQWIDEFHHALRTLLTGEKNAYYEDFGDIRQLEKSLRQAYVYDGCYSIHRKKTFGGQADHAPYSQFVVFAQNHDQIGNRPLGDRLNVNISSDQVRLAAATVLLSPYVPLIFMGEEYGETRPFPFFVDFGDPALIESVRQGRKAEFPQFTLSGSGEARPQIPDPQAVETFQNAVLSLDYREGANAVLFGYYRHLIGLRKTRPALQGRTRESMTVHPAAGEIIHFERRIISDQLFIWLHFGNEEAVIRNKTGSGLRKLFDSAATRWGGPGEISCQEIAQGGSIRIPPWSAIVYEINEKS
jgi:maltooligosyltrehalose trehalohydrolase